ncbi:MAG: hypothetical protein C0471_01940 [Erythrobacter sp.]|nr:hypothetical protein [Erythrobacter sp.]
MKFKAEQDRPLKRPRRKPRKPKATPLAAHPVFAPLLGAWGAALVGLSIMVLPAPLMVRASKGTGLVLLGDGAQAVLAGFAALVVGGTMFLFASQLTRKARRRADAPSIVSIANRRVRTIDPARELGSLRLDDPVETEPFAGITPAPEPVAQPEVNAAAEDLVPPPRALELAEFAQLPGRNAVWVEETPLVAEQAPIAPIHAAPAPQPVAAPEPVISQPIPITPVVEPRRQPAPRLVEHPSDAALARLRETAPEQLSLAEMVERFAGALHEHRETAPNRPMTPQDIAAREAALAEALRALAALSGDARPAPASEPLADALTRLHSVRGAA